MNTNNFLPWSLQEAINRMDESVDVSFGIQDRLLFDEIVDRKNYGDQNAMYVYAIILLSYDIASEIDLLDEDAKEQGIKLLYQLAELEHPQACRYLAERFSDKDGRQLIEEITNLNSQQLLERQLSWFRIAISNREHAHIGFADTLLFRYERDDANLKMLVQSTSYIHDDQNAMKEAFNSYLIAATEGRDEYSGARMAEAYYWGSGVEKNDILAFAWAKFILERMEDDAIYRNIGFLTEITEKLNLIFSEHDHEKMQAYYVHLLATIPLNNIKFNPDLDDDLSNYVTYTSIWAQGGNI